MNKGRKGRAGVSYSSGPLLCVLRNSYFPYLSLASECQRDMWSAWVLRYAPGPK